MIGPGLNNFGALISTLPFKYSMLCAFNLLLYLLYLLKRLLPYFTFFLQSLLRRHFAYSSDQFLARSTALCQLYSKDSLSSTLIFGS